MSTYQPYVYIVGWPDQHRYYIGCRFSKKSKLGDIWQNYFTSSPAVHRFAEDNGPPPYIDIISTHDTPAGAIEAEERLLADNKLHLRNDFLNLNVGGMINMTPEVCAKLSATQRRNMTARYRDPAERQMMSEKIKNSWADADDRRKRMGEITKARWAAYRADPTLPKPNRRSSKD